MRILLAAGLLALLSACAGQQDPPAGPDIPEGAIPAGEDVYYVPLDYTEADGCQPYRLYSPNKLVTQAIYYRKADGTFTMNKREAACHGG